MPLFACCPLLLLDNGPTADPPSKDPLDIFAHEEFVEEGGHRRRTFLVAQLALFVVAPHHYVAYVQKGQTVGTTTLDLVHHYFLSFSFYLCLEI